MESSIINKDMKLSPLFKRYLHNRDEIESILIEWSLTAGNLIKQRLGDKTQVLVTMYTLERLMLLITPSPQNANAGIEDDYFQDTLDPGQSVETDVESLQDDSLTRSRDAVKRSRNFI